MELARAVLTTVHVTPGELVATLERITERVLDEQCVDLTPIGDGPRRESDGRPTSESILDRRYTTEFILDEERAIVDWADERWSTAGVSARLRDVGTLDPALAYAASFVAGTNPLVVVVGPAGTGKTTMLRAAVRVPRRGRSACLRTRTIGCGGRSPHRGVRHRRGHVDKLLAEYATPGQLPDPRYLLPAGTTVIVDEAGMLATPKLADLTALTDHMHWRVVLVGDPRSSPPSGAAGCSSI